MVEGCATYVLVHVPYTYHTPQTALVALINVRRHHAVGLRGWTVDSLLVVAVIIISSGLASVEHTTAEATKEILSSIMGPDDVKKMKGAV